MVKVNKKIVCVLLLVFIVLMVNIAPVFAYELPVNVNPKGQTIDPNVSSTGNKILAYIQGIGTFIAVGVLMFLGIKYMTASANEKADIKKSIIPYIIGAIILLVAVNIVPIIGSIGDTLFSGK